MSNILQITGKVVNPPTLDVDLERDYILMLRSYVDDDLLIKVEMDDGSVNIIPADIAKQGFLRIRKVLSGTTVALNDIYLARR